jgi:hypothetical protein
MSTLIELAQRYGTDKANHGFIWVYAEHFEPVREEIKKVLEIGVYKGESLQMWRDYFPNLKVALGWDINYYPPNSFGPKIVTAIVNQERLGHVKYALETLQRFDVIIDDGSHTMLAQQSTLGYLWPLLKPGGTFIIEDLHTSLPHNPYEWAGGQCRPDFSNSTLLALKRLQQGECLRSEYMTDAQESLIMEECSSCQIFDTMGDERHITSILTKKKD